LGVGLVGHQGRFYRIRGCAVDSHRQAP
jgi:hypothetical protein